ADLTGAIKGLPADVEPATARLQVSAMAAWLRNNLDRICGLEGDDIDFFHDEWKDIPRLAAKWPTKPRPHYSNMPCPDDDCKGRIAVHPPEYVGDDQRIVCEGCGRWFPPAEYEHFINLFAQIKAEKKTAKQVAEHLAQKYAG
ncbi:MAG TPA: hypothetical protein PK890_08755, partial [Terrimesophilobacter sp.]|nr:hypothetical protein [Terrimesophilobacter sp.]